ncbi:hypothetical protein HCN44_006242 [Aphidius gifuensis]|uniref:C-type lectin domain-containing protein n=2 Tax=Aphidius gifuensis TaxID=684658 RepID=A0A835CRD3_APHGI|nr:hypothetical protein HCN44_006242 [Aphidius gifuensis]
MFNNFENIYKNKYFDNLNNNDNNAGIGRFGNREFTLFVNRKTWSEAMLECWRNSLEFVEVKTMDEARKLSRIMLKNRPDAIESIWVGAFERSDGDNIYWRWLSGDNIQDDNELWKNQVVGNKKLGGWSECLLLDWHFWENPSFRKTPCDRKRGYICQKTIASNDLGEPDYDQHEDRRFLSEESTSNATSTTTTTPTTTSSTVAAITFTTASTMTNSLMTTQLPMSSEPVQVHSTKSQEIITPSPTNDSLYPLDDYEDDSNNNDLTNSTSLKIDTSTESLSTASPIMHSKKPPDDFIHQQQNLANVEIKTPSSIHEKIKKKNDFQPLKLYYAFEGPVIVGLTSTVMPEARENFDLKPKSSRPKYHKFIIRRKNKKQRQREN